MKRVTSLLVMALVVSLILVGCAKPAPVPAPAPVPTPAPAPTPAPGEEAASFYKGKNISFVVPYTPGGGYDIYARLITPYLEKETGATVLVRNMPGGGTYVANNHVYNAKPDGLTLLIANGTSITLNQLAKEPAAKGIDILKFNWLARVTYEPSAIILGTKSPYRSIDDLLAAKQAIKFGADLPGDMVYLPEAIFIEATGVNGEILVGLGGTGPISLATMRGEIDAFGCSASSTAEFIEQPELFALCVVSGERSPLLPDVPTISELVSLTLEKQKWIDVLDRMLGVSRSIVTTPGIPEGRLQFLRSTLDKCLHDGELLAKAKELGRPITYLSGEEVARYVSDILTMPEDEAEEAINVMMKKYTRGL